MSKGRCCTGSIESGMHRLSRRLTLQVLQSLLWEAASNAAAHSVMSLS